MWYNVSVVLALLVMSGTYAGLTLALFSIKISSLERKINLGDMRAKILLPIRKNGNLLLCTLLLGNAASYTIMAIYLASFTSGVTASIIATALIFLFGEILPQAVFPRYAIEISARLSWLIWLSLIVFYPVAAPIAWALDRLLGKESPVLWSKEELGEIIKYHEGAGDGIIDTDEKRIVLGALSFSDLKATDIMIPAKEVFYLTAQTKIDRDNLNKIKESGFSRVPILNNSTKKIKGILYTRKLIGLSPSEHYRAIDLCDRDNIIMAKGNIQLDDLLDLLISKKIHMAILSNDKDEFIGIATLEDIMEEILKTELEDNKV